MAIVVGLDVHRAQITYDALNTATGEVATGRITPADRPTLRAFLRRWAGEDVEAAVEATTGWRFVVLCGFACYADTLVTAPSSGPLRSVCARHNQSRSRKASSASAGR